MVIGVAGSNGVDVPYLVEVVYRIDNVYVLTLPRFMEGYLAIWMDQKASSFELVMSTCVQVCTRYL